MEQPPKPAKGLPGARTDGGGTDRRRGRAARRQPGDPAARRGARNSLCGSELTAQPLRPVSERRGLAAAPPRLPALHCRGPNARAFGRAGRQVCAAPMLEVWCQPRGHGSLRPVLAPRALFAKPRAELDARRHRAQPGCARDARGKIPHGRPPNRALFTPNSGHGRISPGGGGGAQAAIAGPTPPPSACAPRLRLGAAPGDTPRRPHPCPARLGPVSFLALGKIQSPGESTANSPGSPSIRPSRLAGGQRWLRKKPGGRGGPQPFTQLPARDGSGVLAAGCWHPSAPRSLQQAVPQGHQAATTVRVGAELTHQVPKPQAPSPPATPCTKAAQV